MAFNPNALRYDRYGMPILSALQIEQIATEVLQSHCPEVLREPTIVPVMEILERLKDRTGLQIAHGDLGHKESAKILGKVNFITKTLWLDDVLFGARERAFRFTAAHEIGHWILHRYNFQNWKFGRKLTETGELSDDERTLFRLAQRTPRERLEIQANTFAASLILPTEMFLLKLVEVQLAFGINRNIGKVVVTDTEYSRRDFAKVVDHLRTFFHVSNASVKVRFKTLGLLDDHQDQSTDKPFNPFTGPFNPF